METTIRKTIGICGVVVGFGAMLYVLFIAKTILLYLVVAIMLAIAIYPLVSRIEKILHVRKTLAVILSYIILGVLVGLIIGEVIVPLAHQGTSFIRNIPTVWSTFLQNPHVLELVTRYHLENSLAQLSNQTSGILLGGGGSIVVITGSIIAQITATTIVLVLTFLLQIEGENIWHSLLGFLTEKDAANARRIGAKITKAISGFVSGNLFISLIAGTVTFFTLWLLKVPYAFALAGLVAVFDLIPLIGASIATIAIGLVALSKGLFVAILAVGIILIYQFVEGHFIQPIVYSKSINLSALIIVIASVFGAELGGILGILMAIPVAAVIQIICIETYEFFANRKVHTEVVG
ncbi:MAG: AI-2E family transporter [bacterium]